MAIKCFRICQRKTSKDEEKHSRSRRRKSSLEQRNQERFRTGGITIQIILFITNGMIWVLSILAIVGGFIIGLNTKTINIRFELRDLTVTTPATIFITYGIVMVLAANLGCFTATGGNKWMTTCYIIAAILVIIFDGVFGIRAFFSTQSLLTYMRNMRGSMDGYGREDGEPVGIFRLNPTIYWDHLQSKGQCCGMEFYDDWRNTTLGRELKSVPDTCCNPDYEYKSCGSFIFHHPDTERHEASDIIYTRGCLKIFPAPLVASFEDTIYMGIMLGTIILFCILLAIVLLVLVLTKKYIPGGGPEEWKYHHVKGGKRHRSSDASHGRSRRGSNDRDDYGRANRRIGPAGGDQKRGSVNEAEQERRVSFKGTSLFIPNSNDRRQSGPKENAILYNEEKRRNSD